MSYKNFIAKNSLLIFFSLISLISFAIFIIPFYSKGYLLYSDSIPFTLNFQSFSNLSNFVYAEKYLGLLPNPVYIMNFFLVHKIFYILSLFFKQETLTVLYIFFPFLLHNLSLFFSFNLILNNKYVSALLTMSYVFSIVSFDMIFTGGGPLWSNIGGFIFFSSFIKLIQTKNYKYIPIIVCSSVIGFMNIAFFYCCVLGVFFYFIAYLIVKANVSSLSLKGVQLSVYLLLTVILILLINSFWILPSLKHHTNVTDTYKTDRTLLLSRSKLATPLHNFQFSYVFRDEPIYSKLYSIYNSSFYRIFFLIALCLSLYGITRKARHSDVLILLIVFILLFFISLGTNFVFWDFLSIFPGWFLLRDPTRVVYFLFFVYLLTLGNATKQYRHDNGVYLWFLGMFILVNSFVFFNSNIWSYHVNNALPKDYLELQKYLSTIENRTKTAIFLPEFSWYPRYRWMQNKTYVPVISEVLIQNPVILSFFGRNKIPKYFNNFYDNKVPENAIAEYLGATSVKYVIINKDDIDSVAVNNFDQEKGLNKIINGVNLALYEVKNQYYHPLITASPSASFIKVNPTKYRIKIRFDNKAKIVFNMPYSSDWQLYPSEKYANFTCDKSLTAYLSGCKDLNRFFEGEEFKYFFLKPQLYSTPKRKADFGNEWTLSEADLIKTLPQNEYIVHKDGTIEIQLILFYKPQLYFYVGLLISCFVFLCLAALLIYKTVRFSI